MFFIVSAIDILALSASGNSVHIGEIVSKLFLLVSAAVIVEYIHNELDEKLKKLFYLVQYQIMLKVFFIRRKTKKMRKILCKNLEYMI